MRHVFIVLSSERRNTHARTRTTTYTIDRRHRKQYYDKYSSRWNADGNTIYCVYLSSERSTLRRSARSTLGQKIAFVSLPILAVRRRVLSNTVRGFFVGTLCYSKRLAVQVASVSEQGSTFQVFCIHSVTVSHRSIHPKWL